MTVPFVIKEDGGEDKAWKKLPIAWRVRNKNREYSLLQSDVAKMFRRLEFQDSGEERFGTTWIELFVIYKAMGYKDPIFQNGRGAKNLPSLGKQLKAFKANVRNNCRKGIQGVCGEFLKAGAKKGYALKRLGVTNHMAAIRGKVRMSEKVQIHVDKEILRANGNLLKDLESQVRGEKEVEFAELTLKRKARWSKGVKRFPNELIKQILEEPTKPEIEHDEGAPIKKEKANTVKLSARIEAPVHDFVQPPVFKGSKRKASAEAPHIGGPVLRASMLSARLRERFGYLCTDTG